MKKNAKKPLSLSTETLRRLVDDQLVVGGKLPPSQTLGYSICWTCGRDGCGDTWSILTSSYWC